MKKTLTNAFKAFSLLFAISFVVAACNKNEDDAPQPEADVKVVHASPDAPGVDLLVDNAKVNSSALSFPQNTGYLSLKSGTRNIKVNASGTSTTVINADVPFGQGKKYSVYAYDVLNSIKAFVVEDNLATPASGKAHIRFFHLSPGAPAVNVGVLSGATFTGVFTNRSFETQATATANAVFTPVDAGTYNFDVRVAGTTTSVLTLNNINLQAGKIYTVFAKGIVGNSTTPLGAEIIAHN